VLIAAMRRADRLPEHQQIVTCCMLGSARSKLLCFFSFIRQGLARFLAGGNTVLLKEFFVGSSSCKRAA
jgi:hypothetical protein